MAENFDKFMDLPFIRWLVADPYWTSDKARKFIRELPAKLDNSEVVQWLDKLWKTNEEIARWITDIVLSSQRWYQDVASDMNDFSSSVASSIDDMSWGFESWLNDLSSSMEAIYGGKLPEGKSMVEIWQELSFQGKKTLVALAANGWVSDHQLQNMFHPNFVYYLRQWYSSNQVSVTQSNLVRNIYALQEAKAKLLWDKGRIEQQRDKIPEWSENYDKRNELLTTSNAMDSQISSIDTKAKEIYQQLLPNDQIQLLDVARVAKNKDIRTLISEGMIDRRSLGLLIKSRQISGDMVNECVNIAIKDKEGRIKPFVPMDGVSWILQETRLNRKIGNVGIVQREDIKNKLDTIDDSLVEWFDATNSNLEYISDKLSDGFDTTNENLGQIHAFNQRIWEISYGIRLPEEKKLSELMENAGSAWKKTLLALYAKGLVDNGDDSENALYRVFSSYFHEHLRKGTTSEEAREIREEKTEALERLHEEYSLVDSKKSASKEDDLRVLRDKMSEVQKWLISEDEIELLDVYREAKKADNVKDLIRMWFLDDETLENLVRHQKVDGETSLELSRMLKVDENGVNPKLDLDGDAGRNWHLRAQTMQWNIALKQRGIMIQNLENIWEYLQQTNVWIDYVNSNLESISGQMDEQNWYLYDIRDAHNETNSLLDQSNALSEEQNFLIRESNALSMESNSLLEEWNSLSRMTNQLLAGIGNQIAFTWAQIVQVLEDVGEMIVSGFEATLDVLHDMHLTDQAILQELHQQSQVLHSIDKKLARPLDTQANEYFIYGMEMLWATKHPSKEDRTAALESFENWLKLRNTHLLNLYGAWTASKNIWKYKKSASYLDRAYKIACKANDDSLAKNIAMDLAKIHTKHLNLKIAKFRLDEVISHDAEYMEAYLLKARITNILHQKEESEVLLNILYRKIIQWDKKVTLTGNYEDVLKYIYKPATDFIDQQIQTWVLTKLLDILPNLQSIWHKDAVKTIISSVLFHYPQKLFAVVIDVQAIIREHKDFFIPLYQECAVKKFTGWNSKDFFAVAYLWYGSIDFGILDSLMMVWLRYDMDYIALKNAPSPEKSKVYKTNLQNKIYALWPSAKYMLRDYLKAHPDSLLI